MRKSNKISYNTTLNTKESNLKQLKAASPSSLWAYIWRELGMGGGGLLSEGYYFHLRFGALYVWAGKRNLKLFRLIGLQIRRVLTTRLQGNVEKKVDLKLFDGYNQRTGINTEICYAQEILFI